MNRMKVLMINGSPNAKGCTYTALEEIAAVLNKEGVETEIYHLGNKPISGCIACRKCFQTGRCVISDSVNEVLEKVKDADGLIFGSSVHYAAPSGMLVPFMDRLFFGKGEIFAYKPVAAVVSTRRSGATAAFEQMNQYFTVNNMLVVGSQYWNIVHGNRAEEVQQDLEGMQTMRTLGLNMAWILKVLQAAKEAGINLPQREPKVVTNFIR